MSSSRSSRNSSIDDPIRRLYSDKKLQRDFREFLTSAGVPDKLVYVDFIEACGELQTLHGDQLRSEIQRIFNHHIRTFAADKIFFDDMGTLKSELENQLTKMDFDADFYSKAVEQCFEKVRHLFEMYSNAIYVDYTERDW